MFLLPAAEGVSCDGSSDEQPLVLERIRKDHFRLLLKAMKFPAEVASGLEIYYYYYYYYKELTMSWKFPIQRKASGTRRANSLE
jgi:hypothetical protein